MTTGGGKPVVLLDFDGVINALAKFSKVPGAENLYVPPRMLCDIWPKPTWRMVDWDVEEVKFPIKWSTDMVRKICAIHADGVVEIRWHTTWQSRIYPLAEHLGLPEFATQQAPEADEHWGKVSAHQLSQGKPGWWKYAAAERVLLDEKRPLIWVDDELTSQVSHLHRDKMRRMGRFLPLSPDEQTGLTPRHFRLLGQFIHTLENSNAGVL